MCRERLSFSVSRRNFLPFVLPLVLVTAGAKLRWKRIFNSKQIQFSRVPTGDGVGLHPGRSLRGLFEFARERARLLRGHAIPGILEAPGAGPPHNRSVINTVGWSVLIIILSFGVIFFSRMTLFPLNFCWRKRNLKGVIFSQKYQCFIFNWDTAFPLAYIHIIKNIPR